MIDRIEKIKRRFLFLLVKMGVVVGIVIHFYAAISQRLWSDELSGLFGSRLYSAGDLFGAYEMTHPGGYYLLIKLLFEKFSSIVFLRLVHFFLFLIILWLVIKVAVLLDFGKHKRWLLCLFWTWSPYILRYTYQLRMYAMGILFVLISLCLILKYLKEKDLWWLILSVMFSFFGFFVVYGYLYFVLIVAMSSFLFFGKRKANRQLKSLSVAYFLLFLFCCFYLIRVGVVGSLVNYFLNWVRMPDLMDLGYMIGSLLGLSDYWNGYPGRILFSTIGYIFLFGAIISFFKLFFLKKISLDEKDVLLDFVFGCVILSLILVCMVWLFANVFNFHIFHVRQFFSVAVFCVFQLFFLVEFLYKKRRYLGAVFVFTVFFVVYVGRVKAEFLFGNQCYGESSVDFYKSDEFVEANRELVYVFENDYEFLYEICGALSKEEAIKYCSRLGFEVVPDFEILNELVSKRKDSFILLRLKGPIEVSDKYYKKMIDSGFRCEADVSVPKDVALYKCFVDR